MQNIENFIKNKEFKIEVCGSRVFCGIIVLFCFLVIYLYGINVIEKIICGIITYVFIFYNLFGGTHSRMKNRLKRNRFIAFNMLFASMSIYYASYRVAFQNNDNFIWSFYVLHFLICIFLQVLRIRKNIKMDIYKDTEKLVVNIYTILGFMSCCIFGLLGLKTYAQSNGDFIYGIAPFVTGIFGFMFSFAITWLYQNYLIKKYDLYYLLKD